MEVRICRDYEEMSLRIAEFIADYVARKPDAVLCFPAGETPAGTFRRLVEFARDGRFDCSRCSFVGLDEWAGIGRHDDGSCMGFMYDRLFTPLSVPESRIHFFDALAEDLEAECRRIDEIVAAKGGVDLMYVGLGMNGHIGLNEPGADPESYSHVAVLDAVTKTVGQKYFTGRVSLDKGITLGLRHMLEADTVLLAASGAKKAPVVGKVVHGDVTSRVPGSLVRRHASGFLYLDDAAAAEL
ncbi:glucosamine-6-phosphate deaminase [Paenibacillus humicola]|uniref:glucosamine-6-phosphate deaminase n=1 Tax=Paenibacillus humicola TaxID=3110540 RepID=UPI00237C5249|nr:glucosamine-6-phosphate deaminase [Paenibacillus humicola]